MRGFRIVFNVELHRRANIACVAGAAHENHLLDALNDLGLGAEAARATLVRGPVATSVTDFWAPA